jgi:hypothetical protein
MLACYRNYHGTPPLTVFNLVLDVCRVARAWRRGLIVFQAAIKSGLTPTTTTYELLCKCAEGLSRDDALDVYAAFKAAGVPHQIAYAASVRTIEVSSEG